MTGATVAGSSAELNALRVEAAADAVPAAAPGAETAPAEKVDQVEQWVSLLTMARGVAVEGFPKLAAIYDDAALQRLAKAISDVAVKYDFTAWDFLDKFKEEIALAFVVVPLAKQTAGVIREARAEKAPKPAGAPAVEGADEVPKGGGDAGKAAASAGSIKARN